MRNIYYFTFVYLLPLLSQAAVQFTVSTATQKVPVDDDVHLTVTAHWPQNGDTYLILKPLMPAMSGLAITDHICFNETVRCGSQTVHRSVHQFKLAVTNQSLDQAETGPIYVQYRSYGSTENQNAQLHGITYSLLPARNAPLTGTLIALGSLTILSAGVFVVKRSANRRRENTVYPPATLEKNLLQQLHRSKQQRLEGDLPSYFHELESMLRRYFRDKYRIGSIEEWQPPAAGPAGPDERTVTVARDLLTLAHRVRYAGYLPNAHDQHRFHAFLTQLFERNLPRSSAPEEALYLKQENNV